MGETDVVADHVDPFAGRVSSQRPYALPAMHVIGSEMGERPAPLVLVLGTHQPSGARREGRVAAAAGLDARLSVRADHVHIVAELLAVEGPRVEVQHDG